MGAHVFGLSGDLPGRTAGFISRKSPGLLADAVRVLADSGTVAVGVFYRPMRQLYWHLLPFVLRGVFSDLLRAGA